MDWHRVMGLFVLFLCMVSQSRICYSEFCGVFAAAGRATAHRAGTKLDGGGGSSAVCCCGTLAGVLSLFLSGGFYGCAWLRIMPLRAQSEWRRWRFLLKTDSVRGWGIFLGLLGTISLFQLSWLSYLVARRKLSMDHVSLLGVFLLIAVPLVGDGFDR